jgi:hypothetical protein
VLLGVKGKSRSGVVPADHTLSGFLRDSSCLWWFNFAYSRSAVVALPKSGLYLPGALAHTVRAWTTSQY